VSSALTTLKGFSQKFQYFLGILWMPSLALIDLTRGRYWHALLLSDSFRSFHFRLLNPEQISLDYLFHNSGYLFRPIWTYDAEERGARVLFYFYSSNIERFKDPGGYGIQPYSWQIITWSNYLVWDEYQADFIRRMAGDDRNIEIVGPIDFHDSSVEFQHLPKHSVLVFDVQPHRDAQYQMHVVVPEYFVPPVVNKFLEDIFVISNRYDLNMVLKRKRHIGNLLNRKYRNLVEKLAESTNFISIDPDVAALRLIREAEIVISFPFTATALIARVEGKSSIFYDPSGLVQKDDRAAHGVEIVSGFEELDKWFHDYLIAKKNLSEIAG
jgi:polysaccharide biosynthesis PFTS motif protein